MQTYPYISLNTSIQKIQDLDFPISDGGFLYGYGLFETLLIHNSEPTLINEHLERLLNSAKELNLSPKFPKKQIHNSIIELIAKNQTETAILNIYLTAGNRDYTKPPFQFPDPQLLIVIRPYIMPSKPQQITCEFRKITYPRSSLDKHKTMSYTHNILEKNINPKIEPILYDEDGYILESTYANVFFIKENIIFTPNSEFILPGTIRKFLLENQSQFGYEITAKKIHLSEIKDFDEIFLTNSVGGIILIEKTNKYTNLFSKQITKKLTKNLLFE